MTAPAYPALEFLVRHGNAGVGGGLAPAIGGVLAWMVGLSVGYAIAGVVAASSYSSSCAATSNWFG